MSYFGGLFPEGVGLSYWGGHFPEDDVDTGLSPPGAATFALVLESGVTVKYAWQTGLFKSYSGLERRSNLVDDPAQRFEGEAVLVGNQTRAARTRLAKYAALGQPFLLGLSYEALTIDQDSTGTTVHVPTTTLSDWAVYGARVVVRHAIGNGVYEFADGVIAAVTANTIELVTALGSVGLNGAEIMPAFAVYLDAQQGFARYRPAEPIERWAIKARNAIAGFSSAAKYAQLSLASPLTTGVLQNVVLQWIDPGSVGNSFSVTFTNNSFIPTGQLIQIGQTFQLQYMPGVTTVADVAFLFTLQGQISMLGTWTDSDLLSTGIDDFPIAALTGGAEATPAEVGRGAVVNEFAGRPVWDRELENDGTVLDSLQSLATAQDLGGLPFVAGATEIADWGRAIGVLGELGPDWQWFKRFLDTVRASWRSFWLPTWRRDLIAVSSGVGTLTILSGEDAGDLLAWWPLQRNYLQIWQADNTKTYVRVATATDNHNGTLTLGIVDEDDLPVTLSGSGLDVISWLERVRFEKDVIDVEFSDAEFSADLTARAIQSVDDPVGQDPEWGAETSQPRDGIEIRTPGGLSYHIATGTRPQTINGVLYTPSAAARDDMPLMVVGQDGAVTIHLPSSHPIAKRYLANNFPPRLITVNVHRYQVSTASYETQWRGEVESISVPNGGHVVRLSVPSRNAVAMKKRLPTISASTSCIRLLYDENCRADRPTFTITTTIAAIDGRRIRCDVAMDDQWSRGGEILHVASGERMPIFDQTSTIDLAGPHAFITMQAALAELGIGDTVEISAGCDHSTVTCRNKFNNMPNFGGFPQLPASNPFLPGPLGIIRS